MNIPLVIFATIGVIGIFAAAAWVSPKVIRAIYPEAQHERMLKLNRIMIIIAIIVGFFGITSAVLVPLLIQSSS